MKIYYGDKLYTGRGAGVALGNFDGLHKGHMELINVLARECKNRGLTSVVYTFTKHPENILRKELFMPILTTVEKKIEVLEKTDIEVVYFDEFDEEFCEQGPKEFVKNVLVDRLGMKLAVVGEDYRFGYKGIGDIGLLKKLGKEHGFEVEVVSPVLVNGKVVSSTYIRQLLLDGDVEEAAIYLGRRFSVRGKVVHGASIGRGLGFPTANIIPEDYLLMPANGVYVTMSMVDGKLFKSISNTGVKPTFGDNRLSIETYLLDYSGDIYDHEIEVFFLLKIRNEIRFSSGKELAEQIKVDLERAEEYFKVHKPFNIV